MVAHARLTDTTQLILDAAERRAQAFGFNGFSYGDVAAELGLSTASLHYHFPSKADLGAALVDRYAERFFASLAEIAASQNNAPERLRGYAALYESVLAENRLCLCGMMAAEFETLAEPLKARLKAFFVGNENWLANVLRHGKAAGELDFASPPEALAATVLAALEGAMLVARVHGGVAAFRATTALILRGIEGAKRAG